ncbi:DUF1499 domain-containing protein [Maritalea sp.]|jgi:uncharacterized protein (DUF1499 family)|uniref:DUF1499 domain-containing protein n=1 Tax=Maritalea sp. TaxID=2003361 RepID=UPI0039E71EA8
MRVFIRTSGWAIWAARVTRPILPLILLAIVFHYIGVISSPVFIASIVVAISLAIVSAIFGLIAYVRIWYSGDAGWREATSGVLVGLIAVLFVATLTYLGGQYPSVHDVSTAPNVTPTWSNQSIAEPQTADAIDPLLFQFAATRQYQLSEQAGLELVAQVAASMRWKKLGQSRNGAAELHQYFEAKTLLGFVDDVTVSTRTTARSFIVNLRSSSRFGDADFGVNSKRIEQFLLAMDELVATPLVIQEAH